MNLSTWIDRIPLTVLFGLTLVFVLLAIGSGTRLSKIRHDHSTGGESIGSVVGATLGLLAFMLAFTFNMAANRYDARKQLLMDEVSAIGTAYLRASLLPQPYVIDVRILLRRYVDLRARAAREPDTLMDAIAKSEAIQDQLWSGMEKMVTNQPVSISQSLFIQSLNEMIDLHGKRVIVGLQFRIPSTIWSGLYVVAALAMIAVGYQFGQSHQRQILVNIVLAMAFASVIVLIADLDRASEGTVQVNQQPLFELQQKLHASP